MLLVRFGEIFVARMRQGIGDHDRLHALDNQSGQTLAGAHGDFIDRFAVQAHGGAESQAVFIAIQNIDGANFRLHPVRDSGNYAIEGLLQIVRVADEGADILKNVQMRANFSRFLFCFGHDRRIKT